jgi:predicted glycoside hydrolase/deacetylase ChbG (UPF0249 family)
MLLVDEKACDAAVDYLANYADAAASAYANRALAEHYRKAAKAELILKSALKTQGEREAWAECHPEYLDKCRAESDAIKELEWHRHNMARAKAILDMWRSLNASDRELRRIR